MTSYELIKKRKAISIFISYYLFIKNKYENQLFRINKPSTFKLNNDETLSGIIKGIDNVGKLIIWTEDEILRTFDLKEIKLLY